MVEAPGKNEKICPVESEDMAVVVKTVLGSTILVGMGEFTTHFRTYFGWIGMYDLDFDPWPG